MSFSYQDSKENLRGGSKVISESSDENNSENVNDGEDGENQSSNGSMKEIDELKLLTRDLLNENWRLEQNKKLLYKMLELEEPSISPKVKIVIHFSSPLLSSHSCVSGRWLISY